MATPGRVLAGRPPPMASVASPRGIHRRASCRRARAAPQQQHTVAPQASLDEAYNAQMARQMSWERPFEYHWDRGLYFHEVAPGLCCGTQPRDAGEVEALALQHGIGAIVNLQQDKDIEYWGIDFGTNVSKMAELGVELVRRPARDFDPHSLRNMLPSAVKAVDQRLRAGKRVYVHCTAGLGRAPAVCIAWLYWYGPHLSLDVAYNHVTSIRPCGPKRDAVRGATFDLLDHRSFQDFDWLPPDAWATLSVHDRERLQARLAARRD